MASNRGVVYLGPGKVEVQSIDFPGASAPEAVFQEGAFHGQQSRRRLSGSRQGGSAVHRLSQDAGAQRQGHRSRCHPQDRRHQHLRLGPAHGARPHDRAGRSRAGTRDHGRGDREGIGRRDGRHRRPRHRARSTWRAGGAARAASSRPASASTSTRHAPGARTDTWTWAAGSVVRPTT